MSGTRAERLRKALAIAAWHSGSGVDPSDVLRAIVSELGITREMVEAAEGPIPCNEGDEACYDCQMQYATVRALECLLDAAGVQP